MIAPGRERGRVEARAGRPAARLARTCGPLALLVVVAAVVVASAHAAPDRLAPALSWAPPSLARPLGSGEAGVDLLPLVANAGLRATALALVVAASGGVLGTAVGVLAAFAPAFVGAGPGAVVARVVERLCDLLQAFPSFLLAIAVLSAVRSPERAHLAVVFSLTAWAPFARLAFAQARVLRGASFVEAAFALGMGRARVLARHVVPNLLDVAAAQAGASASAVVVSEAALSFVGLGPRDGVSLGAVLDQGVAAMLRAPHVLVVGSLSVFALSRALLLAGRAVAPRGAC